MTLFWLFLTHCPKKPPIDSELSSLFMISQVNIIHDNNSYVQGESEKDSQIEGNCSSE
jgi:hypothetical protein